MLHSLRLGAGWQNPTVLSFTGKPRIIELICCNDLILFKFQEPTSSVLTGSRTEIFRLKQDKMSHWAADTETFQKTNLRLNSAAANQKISSTGGATRKDRNENWLNDKLRTRPNQTWSNNHNHNHEVVVNWLWGIQRSILKVDFYSYGYF